MTTPYLTGLVVAWSRLVNRIVTRHLRVSITVGWVAIGALFAGVFFVGGHTGMVMALASAPFAGLAIWRAGPGPGGGDDPPPEPDDEPPAPDAVGRSGRRIPAPPRRRPTGHPERRRAPRHVPSR
ncbi:MAG TPA: hypothetical protein VFN64_03695 [Burkholderiaceae bacterium]|nr:hypothetical protein [Burkholderiaceae bacterium]